LNVKPSSETDNMQLQVSSSKVIHTRERLTF
jgi:hypothetical protein